MLVQEVFIFLNVIEIYQEIFKVSAVGFFWLVKSTACLPSEGSKIICPMSQLWGM
jgi:hypothetical protein